MRKINIIEAFEDKDVFGKLFRKQETWYNWKVCLKAIFSLPLTSHEREIYTKFTGRTTLPAKRPLEVFLAVGRRGGKNRITAIIAAFVAIFGDFQSQLAPGEKGICMCIAQDREQADVALNYIKEIFRLPAFSKMVVNVTRDEIELDNRIVIQVKTCSFRALRGYTVICAICDEMAFWRSEGLNPDKEILTALRPTMGTIEGALLLGISTVYAKAGALWEAFQLHGEPDDDTLTWLATTKDMNPTHSDRLIDKALRTDYAAARAEYFSEFRSDLASFLSVEEIDACVAPDRRELGFVEGVEYFAFVDPSGGKRDAMTLSIFHKEESGKVIQDCIRAKLPAPKFDPKVCVKEFAQTIKNYSLTTVTGDRYSGEWCSSAFEDEGITYENSELTKSDIYLEFLPLIMQGGVELLDNKTQIKELRQLERRTGRGKDVVDHPRSLHDDLANACAGAAVMAVKEEKGFAGFSEISADDLREGTRVFHGIEPRGGRFADFQDFAPKTAEEKEAQRERNKEVERQYEIAQKEREERERVRLESAKSREKKTGIITTASLDGEKK